MKNKQLLYLIIVILLLGGLFLLFKPKTQQIQTQEQSPINAHTEVSQKPRDKIITYPVEKGDTFSNIAKKFYISEDTIRWENYLTTDTVAEGQTLRILPVTGISHIVVEGDTIKSLSKKYNTTLQKIIDYPFNEYANPDTFSLIPGKILIIPDGKK